MYHKTETAITMVAITVDDFLVLINTKTSVDTFYKTLAQKYSVKSLGRPSNFLVCTLSYGNVVSIRFTQPELCLATISNAGLDGLHGRCTAYNYKAYFRPPEAADEHVPETESKYQQLFGDQWYLADSTYPALSYVKWRLGAAIHSPTKIHYNGMK